MRIAFIGGRDIHKLGGIEAYMYNLCTKLVGLGHEPIVYCESNSNREEVVNGFKVIYWKSPKSIYLCKIYLGLKSTIDALNKRVDLIHYNAWPPSLWSWIPRLYGVKTIMQGHGLEWERTKYSPIQRRIMKFMEMITAYLNRNLIMVSEEQTCYFKNEYNRECVTIPTAVSIPTKVNGVNSVLGRFNLKPNDYILYLGRLVQEKNPDLLIRSYNAAKIQSKKLVIAGANERDVRYVDYLKKISENNPNIIFTGPVYGIEKNVLLQECAIFCIPSLIEGLAITLLEAMSYKRIIIASDISANREALGNDALWVRAGNEDDLVRMLKEGIANPESYRYQCENNFKKIIEKYNWDIVSQSYIEYCKNICNNTH